MDCLFDKYMQLNYDTASISLEKAEEVYPYFCYPLNAHAIGFEGCIMYCFIEGYGEMVFAANPESCADTNVYPLADDFKDFMRLVLACGSANPVEQIIWMNKAQFEQHIEDERKIQTDKQKFLLDILAKKLELTPMENPFEYVKSIQSDFDDSKIKYSDEYYDVLGIERKSENNI